MLILNASSGLSVGRPDPLTTRGLAPGGVGRASLRRAITTAMLMLALSAAHFAGPVAAATRPAPLAPPAGTFQAHPDPASAGDAQSPAAGNADASMARAAGVLQRQGVQGVAALGQLTQVEVINPLPAPEVMDVPAIEQPAEASNATLEPANATVTNAATTTAMALAAGATGEARATAAAIGERAAAALRATSGAEPSGVARSAWSAGKTLSAARAATMAASRQAASLAVRQSVGALQTFETMQAAQAAPASQGDQSNTAMRILAPIVGRLPIAALQAVFLPMLAGAGVLGLLLWRRKSEPFVLKARPAQA